jgi:hypothetical protein
MSDDIKILEEYIKLINKGYCDDCNELCSVNNSAFPSRDIAQAIESLIKSYKQKDKDNNDLRILYRKTAKKLSENGKEELSNYLLAQIEEIPTFFVEDDIDYYEEYHKFMNGEIYSAKQLKNIEKNQKKYFINKLVIREKIEELKKIKKDYEENYIGILKDYHYDLGLITGKIQVLEELLEDK